MEIKARCKFDYESARALAHLTAYKKTNPKKAVVFRAILCAVLVMIIIADIIAFGFDTIPIVLFIVVAIVFLVNCFIYFVLPKIQYKLLAKMKGAENEYIFCDDMFIVAAKSDEYNGEAEIKYSMIVKVMETSRYIFMYKNNSQVLIVDKSTIVNGTVDQIANKLSSFLGNKYIICKY